MNDGRLNGKYIVERADGQHRPGSRYFVVNYASDPYARIAMLAYADACEETHPSLARDLRDVVAYHQQRADSAHPGEAVAGPAQGAGGGEVNANMFIEVLQRHLDADDQLADALRSMLTPH